jgi:hypothetical protein
LATIAAGSRDLPATVVIRAAGQSLYFELPIANHAQGDRDTVARLIQRDGQESLQTGRPVKTRFAGREAFKILLAVYSSVMSKRAA